MPDYFLTQKYPTGLEDYFTVVWWEQRGSGISYSPDIPPETMTLEQMIADTLAVTNYLRQRFGQEKIYLMGHSGEPLLAYKRRHGRRSCTMPTLAWLRCRISSNRKNWRTTICLQQFKANGNTEMVRKLEAAPVTMTGGTPDAYLALRDQAMHSLGIGTTHDMNSVITGIFLPSLTKPRVHVR